MGGNVFRKNYFLREILRYIPRKRHLHGSWLHRMVGEKLFSSRLWKFSRDQVAKGLALGVFIALTPTMGIQMALAGILAFLLRVNIPLAVAACWITNPVTAPIIYTLQYKLGVWLVSVLHLGLPPGYEGRMINMINQAGTLFLGCLFSGILLSVLTYTVVLLGWKTISRVLSEIDERKHEKKGSMSSTSIIP